MMESAARGDDVLYQLPVSAAPAGTLRGNLSRAAAWRGEAFTLDRFPVSGPQDSNPHSVFGKARKGRAASEASGGPSESPVRVACDMQYWVLDVARGACYNGPLGGGASMRATSHNGRWGTARHNGREFNLDRAEHIDKSRVGDNLYWHWDKDAQGDFLGAEERYYQERFGAALDAQNERHRTARHTERVKTMADWMDAQNTRPEESIWQIGSMEDDVEPEDFAGAVEELQEWLMDWSKEHGEPFQVLTTAIHFDEASPHAHVRRVWQYQDADGTWKIGQNKALEAAGVPLPEPGKPVGKNNNRKITFDKMVREKWLEICESYGYEIESEPDPKHQKHLPKEQFIELQEREDALDKRAIKLRSRETAVNVKEKQQSRREAELDRRESVLKAQEQALDEQARKVQAAAKQVQETLQEAQETLCDCKEYKRTIAEQQQARQLQARQARTLDRAAAAQAMLDRVGISAPRASQAEYSR